MAKYKFCAVCGSKIPAEDHFCSYCASEQPTDESKIRYVPEEPVAVPPSVSDPVPAPQAAHQQPEKNAKLFIDEETDKSVDESVYGEEEESFLRGVSPTLVRLIAAAAILVVLFSCLFSGNSVEQKAEDYYNMQTKHLQIDESLASFVQEYMRRNESLYLDGTCSVSDYYEEVTYTFYPDNRINLYKASLGIPTQNQDVYYDLIGGKLYVWNEYERLNLVGIYDVKVGNNRIYFNDMGYEMIGDFYLEGKADLSLEEIRKIMIDSNGVIDELFKDVPLIPLNSTNSDVVDNDNYNYDSDYDYSYDDEYDYSDDAEYDSEDTESYTAYITHEYGVVYLNDDPDLYDDTRICLIPDGAKVQVFEEANGGRCYSIKYQGMYGYVSYSAIKS